MVSLPLDGLLPFAVPDQDELTPRWFATLFVPVVAAVVWGGFQLGRSHGGLRLARLLFRRAPEPLTQPETIERFRGTYDTIVLWVVVLVLAVHAGFLAAALGSPRLTPRIIALGLGACMIGMGNVMPRLRPNLVAGVRTRRTLTDPQLWRSTHRFLGFAFVASGVVTVAVGLAAPAFGFVTGLALLLASTLAAGFVELRGRGEAPDTQLS
jgi:hypothetical protein